VTLRNTPTLGLPEFCGKLIPGFHKFTVGWGWVVEYGSSNVTKAIDLLTDQWSFMFHNMKIVPNY
jgi:prolyl oligopeptidase PreP (S9A serine peptidase family)